MCRTEILIDKTYEIFSRCYPQFKFTRKSFESLIITSDSHIISYPDEENLIGFAITEGPSIMLICVAPDYQRQGIGANLLAEAEKYVKNQGFDKIYTGGVSSKFLIGAGLPQLFLKRTAFPLLELCRNSGTVE